MVDFQEELTNCDGQKNIIIGNGFGISYDIAFDDDSFSWTTLLDLCAIKEGSQLHDLLNECNFDFELVHQQLNNAIDVISRYSPANTLIHELESQVQYLREQLVIAVANSHPTSFNIDLTTPEGIVVKEKVEACRTFLKQFGNVFSLNYDLLLYWVRCFENNYLGLDSFGKEDGKLVFTPENAASYLFPHGALFLFRDGIGATKSSSSQSNPILARVEENIINGIFPMCVSEGTGEQKQKAINNNSYLSFSYEKIKECQGTIFTFGCSFMDDKDSHIIKAILKSPAQKVVVGEFMPSEKTSLRLEHEFAKIKQELGIEKEVVIADTSGIKLWQP